MGRKIKKPIIFRKKEGIPPRVKIIDVFNGGLRELFFIRHPRFKEGMPEAEKPLQKFLSRMKYIRGVWIYFPWQNLAIHTLPEELFFEIKTARNKNFITAAEQKKYRGLKVGIMGMSVGSNIIWSLVASGGPKFLRIADGDTIEISNLNRMLAPLSSVGENKAVFMAKKIYEMDPFMKLDCWTKYITKNNIEKFMSGLDVLIDEIDDLHLKFLSREIAKKLGIPVIMVTNVGSNVILDIGEINVKNFDLAKLEKVSHKEWAKLATKIVGPENLSSKMKKSVRQVGRQIAGVPQISPTSLISGSLVSFFLLKIASGRKLKSGRYFLNIEEIFNND